MSLQKSFESIFKPNKTVKMSLPLQKPSSSQTISKIFNALHKLINDPTLDAGLFEKYNNLTQYSTIDREFAAIALYKEYETLITENISPNSHKTYSSTEIRQEINKLLSHDEISNLFGLIFQSENERIYSVCTLSLSYICHKCTNLVDAKQLHDILTKASQETLFIGIYINNGTLVFPEGLRKQMLTIPLDDVLVAGNKFYEVMYQEIKGVSGAKKTDELWQECYKQFNSFYPTEIILFLLDMFPKTAVLNLKTEIASRQEFQHVIQRKNAELDEIRKQLEEHKLKLQEQNKTLEDTKSSMVNLLEDLQEEKNNAETERARDDAILENIGDGLIATDNKGTIILINTPAQDLLGWTENEIIGKPYTEIIPILYENDTPVPNELQPITIAITKGERIMTTALSTDTLYFVKKDKSKFAVIVTSTPVLMNKEIIGSISIFRDATHEKEIDKMKTEFISLASHQLRTPLSAIRWFSEMLIGGDAGELTPEQKDFTVNIYDSAQRMIDLVNSLLNISRIESGRIIIDPKPTNLKELVQSIVKELQVKLTEKEQSLIISVHDDLPEVNIDPKLIRQVYLNLLTNAIKYTPKNGEITVMISKKDDQIISQVTDTGYGIPKSEYKKMFQKFFRASNIIKVETDGTGLGLYLIKAIIDSSHGKVWFESEEGKGTTFWFTLPLAGMEAKKGEVTLDS